MLLLALPFCAWGYDYFTAKTIEGVSMTFQITSEDKATAKVGYYYQYDRISINTSVKCKVTIPNSINYNGRRYSVTSIGSCAFNGCTGLPSVTIPNSVTSIGSCAFDGCTGLTSVTIGNSVTSIGGSAFRECTGLTAVTIPNSVTNIEQYAFKNCTGLSKLYISDLATWCKTSFSSSDSNPLYYAHHLYLNNEEVTDLVIPKSVTTIGGYAFYGGSYLTSVAFHDAITEIGNFAFYGCKKLTSVTIPASVTTIGEYAFSDCKNLTSMNIGSSVKKIGNKSFSGCSKLKTIIVNAETPPYVESADIFPSDLYKTATLIVPTESVEDYQTAYPWDGFQNIVTINKETLKAIDSLKVYISEVQAMCTDAVEGTDSGNYMIGSKAKLQAVIDNITARIGILMTDDELAICYEQLNNAVTKFRNSLIPEAEVTDANNYLTLPSVEVLKGQDFILPVFMTNKDAITALQADLYLPDGFSVALDEDGEELIEFGSRTTRRKHSISCLKQDDGSLRIVCGSQSNAVFNGNEGEVLNITIHAEKSVAEGDFVVMLKNIRLADTSTNPYVSDLAKSVVTLYVLDTLNYLNLAPVDAWNGQDFVLPIMMNNKAAITAFQADLYLPDGFSVALDKNGEELIEFGPRTTPRKHSISCLKQDDGSMRIVCGSQNNAVFSGNEDMVLKISVHVDEHVAEGEYAVTLKNIRLADTDAKPHIPDVAETTITVFAFHLGDVNNDGAIDVADLPALVAFILNGNTENFIFKAADLNEDGVVMVDDYVALVNMILGGAKTKTFAPQFRLFETSTPNLSADAFSIKPGEKKEIAINMSSPGDQFTAVQLDLVLPAGISVAKDVDDEWLLDVGSRTTLKKHSISGYPQSDGSFRIVCGSQKNAVFSGENGDIILVTLQADANAAETVTEMMLRNIVLARVDGSKVVPESVNVPVTIGNAVGIRSAVDVGEIDTYYNLQGQRVEHPRKGIYIYNGMKIHIK